MRSELEQFIVELNSTVLGRLNEGSRTIFWTRPKGSLAPKDTGAPITPLEALETGRLEDVLRCARAYAER